MSKNWMIARAKKSAATRKAKDPDAFKKMGAKGGSVPRAKNEQLNSEPK